MASEKQKQGATADRGLPALPGNFLTLPEIKEGRGGVNVAGGGFQKREDGFKWLESRSFRQNPPSYPIYVQLEACQVSIAGFSDFSP
jgi:hypothetical protein